MKKISLFIVLAFLPIPFLAFSQPLDVKTAPNPDTALKNLKEGNLRYVTGKNTHPNFSLQRRVEVAQGQTPFAIIVGCADSRVPPELVFDQGLGDLFVVRVAGEVLDAPLIGSIEYAAEHLHAPLVVVLGHERCGAVKAALEGGEMPGHIGALTKSIAPAVEKAKKMPGDALDNAVRAQVQMVVEQLSEMKPILSEMVESGKLRVVGARYDLDTGTIEFLDSPRRGGN